MHGLLFSFLSLSYMSSLISGTSLLLSVINLSEVEHLVVLVQSITSLVLKCSLNAVTHVCSLSSFLAWCLSLLLWRSRGGGQIHRTVYEKSFWIQWIEGNISHCWEVLSDFHNSFFPKYHYCDFCAFKGWVFTTEMRLWFRLKRAINRKNITMFSNRCSLWLKA